MGDGNVDVVDLEKNTHQGYFGEGMVASIAAAAGLDVFLPRLGQRVDLQVFKPGPLGTSSSRQICLQVKTWSRAAVAADGNFHYPLEVSAFNHLAGKDHDVRHYLILCAVPAAVKDFAHAQHACLRLMRAAYWLSLVDMEPNLSLPPDSKKVVLVPKSHLLTPETLRALVDRNEHLAVVP